MKKLAIIVALTASPAIAQSALTIDDVTTQWLSETGQLRMELAKARLEIAALRKQVEAAKVAKDPEKK